MAAITWQNVVDFFAEQNAVPVDAQTAILAHVNTALSVAAFDGEDGPKMRLARIYLAAHFGELATPFQRGDDVVSKTVSKEGLAVSYAAFITGDELIKTVGGAMYLAMVKTSPVRLGFVAINRGC